MWGIFGQIATYFDNTTLAGRALPRGSVFQMHRPTGRTRTILTGEFIHDVVRRQDHLVENWS